MIERLHAIAAEFEMPAAPLEDDARRGRRRLRRNRVLVAGAAAARGRRRARRAAAVGGQDRPARTTWSRSSHRWSSRATSPSGTTTNGLHRGDVVEETPVEIEALALVRYRCPLPGPEDRRRVVPPLGRGAHGRGTQLRGGARRGPDQRHRGLVRRRRARHLRHCRGPRAVTDPGAPRRRHLHRGDVRRALPGQERLHPGDAGPHHLERRQRGVSTRRAGRDHLAVSVTHADERRTPGRPRQHRDPRRLQQRVARRDPARARPRRPALSPSSKLASA